MKKAAVIERVERVSSACAASGKERSRLTSALSDVAGIESWAAARRADLVRALAERPGSFPEADIAATTGCSLGAASRETERAATLDSAKSFADALDSGDIRPGHVDALTRAAKDLTEEQAASLIGQQAELVDRAANLSIRSFERLVRRRAEELRTEAQREARLERQKRNTRLRSWVDRADGMWCLSGRFDPASGAQLARVLDEATAAIFAESTPATAPTDPLERQQHLAALGLSKLLLSPGDGPARNRPGNPIVVVDATTAQPEPAADTTRADVDAVGDRSGAPPLVDWGIPVELPASVLRDVFETMRPDVVVVADGVVLHAPGALDLGRATRLANRHQRRALRGLYRTCAVPGCSVHYDRCRLHHVIWWRFGGRTDLDNLLPICQHHHTRLHEEGWELKLGPHRELTITFGDCTTQSTGPPSIGGPY